MINSTPTTTTKRGRKPLPARIINELRKLRKQGFSLKELTEISDLSIGAVFKYTK